MVARVGSELNLVTSKCWKSLMLFGMLSLPRAHSLSLCRSDKGFGCALGIDTVLEAIRHERVGCAKVMESGSPLRCYCFPLLARKSVEEKWGHTRKRMDLCRDR